MIQEKVLQWAPAMKVLEEFIDDIMRFSMDSSVDVKKTVAGFIEEVWYVTILYLIQYVVDFNFNF